MDEEIWRTYLETLSEKELRAQARGINFRIDGFRKDHQKTPGPILVNHLAKHPAIGRFLPGIVKVRKKIRDETEDDPEKIKTEKETFFAKYGGIQTIAALASAEEDEFRELGEAWFKTWLPEEEQAQEEETPTEWENEVAVLKTQLNQLEKRIKRAEKNEKDWKSKHDHLKAKLEKERKSWRQKTASLEEELATQKEDSNRWQEKSHQLAAQIAQLEEENFRLDTELEASCHEILIVGAEERIEKRKKIGPKLVNLTYVNSKGDLKELISEKDYIFLQSTNLPDSLRNNLYTLCLRSGKQPYEVLGEKDLIAKLEQILGAKK